MHQENKGIESEQDFENAAELNRQRRVYARRPKRAQDLINNVIARRGIAAEQSSHRLQNIWESVIGMDLANQTRVSSLRRGVLEIIVSNSSLMQILSFNKEQYKEEINQQMQNGTLSDIRFRIGRIS